MESHIGFFDQAVALPDTVNHKSRNVVAAAVAKLGFSIMDLGVSAGRQACGSALFATGFGNSKSSEFAIANPAALAALFSLSIPMEHAPTDAQHRKNAIPPSWFQYGYDAAQIPHVKMIFLLFMFVH